MVQLLISILHEPINHKEFVQFLLHCNLLQLPFCPFLVVYVSNQIEAMWCRKEINDLQGCAAPKEGTRGGKTMAPEDFRKKYSSKLVPFHFSKCPGLVNSFLDFRTLLPPTVSK